ncbi:MAG: 3-deoxy-manno-octulosonate cytidylyltransferase [Pyrinomonadaceae bacterium]|nr:3-deoxy-manno-octulosonate cytidylyltransferase [Pyrinomonadaceae bacterium]
MSHTDTSTQFPTVIVIIPARYNSIRLPGKPLLSIGGRPMILRVVERALAAQCVSRAIVATDDGRIFDVVRSAGYEAAMTSPDHATGSDRLAEVAAGLDDCELIVNVQGDEPLIPAETIDCAVKALIDDPDACVSTTSETINGARDVLSPDVVKVVADARGRALYFSRAPIPYPREAARRHGSLEAALVADASLLKQFRKHTGLYVYRRAFLLEYTQWPQTRLEQTEALEQLRMLEHGAAIRVVDAPSPSIGVDTAEDLARVRDLYESQIENL